MLLLGVAGIWNSRHCFYYYLHINKFKSLLLMDFCASEIYVISGWCRVLNDDTFGRAYLSVAVIGVWIAMPTLPYLQDLFGSAILNTAGFFLFGASITILYIDGSIGLCAEWICDNPHSALSQVLVACWAV
jgi:hypothetical protein